MKIVLLLNAYNGHCVKSVRIWSNFGPYFPTFRLNTNTYGVSLRIQSELGKIQTRITLNKYTFYVCFVEFCNI